MEELEELGSEVVQSGGHDGEKRRSMEAEGGGRVPEGPLAGMTRQLFELHRRKVGVDGREGKKRVHPGT